jgi:alpha-galactosidase/6-phospho-beta-glucosidase family protein
MSEWFWLRKRLKGQEKATMARLDVIQAALESVSADAAAEHQQVMDALAALGVTVSDLQTQVATLTAGQVTDEELAAVAAMVQSVDDQVKAIYEPEPPVA